jgi:hypothetical protein
MFGSRADKGIADIALGRIFGVGTDPETDTTKLLMVRVGLQDMGERKPEHE